MGSLYLNRLSAKERDGLISRLHSSQNGVCFICEQDIDLILHKDAIDIDHVIPIKIGGRDDPTNFALTHMSCNRSKQASDLNVARILYQFDRIRDNVARENRGPNLNDIFMAYGGSQHQIRFARQNGKIRYSLPETNNNQILEAALYRDDLSQFEYFFAKLPIAYLYHDDKINPRSIGQNVTKLVQEFYLKRPQLHISLAWIDLANDDKAAVKIFDGQHKACAQVLLGVRELPVRVFVNPDIDILLTTNTNAGTKLKQVAFDLSVQRHLGSSLYRDRIERYQREHELSDTDYTFSESDLVNHFRGESREIKRYILDAVRDTITHHPDNRLRDYIDFGGRGKERPLSYSTVEKTFYSFFIFQDMLNTPLDFRLEDGENPRELEKQQILELMNRIADEIFIGKYDLEIGTDRIENKIQKGDILPLDHVRAFRMSKEEVIYNWLRYILQIIKNYFIMQGRPIQEKKVFQYKFPEPLWDKIDVFLRNFSNLPVWVNNELSYTVFGGKQNYEYWQTIFETGRSPQGVQVLAEPIDLMNLIKE